LCDELRELGFSSVRLNRGGIPFRGEWQDGWRACLESRIAQRVQVLLARFPADAPMALYRGIQGIDWSPYITAAQTLAVSSVCRGSHLKHSGFVALKAKDAIVDQVRAREGQRPSVSRDDPDVRVFVYLVEDRAAVYLDLSGEPLHRRGYRQQTGQAPLRETLAAAMLRLSEWDRSTPLVDPMCGSGTIAIEAAQWSAGIAPGLARGRFGFERWANFGDEEAGALRAMCGELRRAGRSKRPRITASDMDPEMVDAARHNARAAGVKPAFRTQSFSTLQSDGSRRWLVTNPPYGVRLEAQPQLIHEMAATIQRLHGWRVCLLAGNEAFARSISLNPVTRHTLPNGALECELLVYDVP
jgi:putative N6-adenine-specific DNA methylase